MSAVRPEFFPNRILPPAVQENLSWFDCHNSVVMPIALRGDGNSRQAWVDVVLVVASGLYRLKLFPKFETCNYPDLGFHDQCKPLIGLYTK